MSAEELRDFIANHFKKSELSCSDYDAQRNGGPGTIGPPGMKGCMGTCECFTSQDEQGICRRCCPLRKLIPEDTNYRLLLTFLPETSHAEQVRLIEEVQQKFPGFNTVSYKKNVVGVEDLTPETIQDYESKSAEWELRKNQALLHIEKARALGVIFNGYRFFPERPSKITYGLEKLVTVGCSVHFDGDSELGKLLSAAGFALDFEHYW